MAADRNCTRRASVDIVGVMRAIRPNVPGAAEVLRVAEFETPTPGPLEILVRIAAIGVNYIDIYQRSGQYQAPFPLRLGIEGAGRVEAIGVQVSSARVGDRVAWAGVDGSYASHVILPADRAVPLPDGIPERAAAALLEQGLTAHYLANDVFPLRPGHSALIHAAAGGVGQSLVRLAKHAGARVLGTVSTPAKAALARQAGADEVILYTQQNFQEQTRRFTEGRGVNVVYDSVGAATFDLSLRSLMPRGYLVLYGQASGPVPPLDPLTLAEHGSLFLTRPKLVHYTQTRAELLSRAHALFDLFARGVLRVRVDRELPLSAAAEAHRALEQRLTAGKVLLIPD